MRDHLASGNGTFRNPRAIIAGGLVLFAWALPLACTDSDSAPPAAALDAGKLDVATNPRSDGSSPLEDAATGTDASPSTDSSVVTDATNAGDASDATDAAAPARILYVGGGNIWVMNDDGTNKTNLTNTSGINYGAPAWSPDRTKIAFHSDKDDGPGEIYVMDANGSNMVRLTNVVGEGDVEPAWSPDGTQIAFASRRDGLISSIYVMDAATGANVVRVTNALPGSDQAPSWSSGNRIAFWTNEGSIGLHIAIVDVNPTAPFDAGDSGAVWGTNRTGLPANRAYGLHPAWSPDGTKIAFSAESGRHIAVMNADGTGQVDLTGGVNEDFPTWSPDGTRIAFDRNVSGKVEIFTMNANGSNQVALTSTDAGPSGSNASW